MAFKIGNVALSDIVVNDENGNPIDIREVNVKKNNVTTKVWGKRSVTINVTNYSYISSITATYNDAGGYSKTVSITATTTLSDVGYDQSVTISATAKTDTAQWDYSVTGGGTYPSSTSTISIVGSRELRKYTVVFTGTYVRYYYYDEDYNPVYTTGEVNIPYGTSITGTNSYFVIGDTTYYIAAKEITAQYIYSNETINTAFPLTVTENTAITGTATRTVRKYNVTVGFKYNSTTIATQTLNVEYGTVIDSSTYYTTNGYNYTNTYDYTFSSGTKQTVTVTGSNKSAYTTYTSCKYTISVYLDSAANAPRVSQVWVNLANVWRKLTPGTSTSQQYNGYPGSSKSITYFGLGKGINNGGNIQYWYTCGNGRPYSSGTCKSATVYSTYTITQNSFTWNYMYRYESASNQDYYTMGNTITSANTDLTLKATRAKDASGVSNANCRNAFQNMVSKSQATSSTAIVNDFIADSLFDSSSTPDVWIPLGDYVNMLTSGLYNQLTENYTTYTYEILNGTSVTYKDGSSSTTVSNFYGLHIKATPEDITEEEGSYTYGQKWDFYLLWHHASTYNTRLLIGSGDTDAYTQNNKKLYICMRVSSSD